MPKSQLKQLKAALHDKGLVGQSQTSKKKKKNEKRASHDQRAQRYAALQSVRDAFNPFELQQSARPKKFEATTTKTMGGNQSERPFARPGVTRSLGEENRKRTLLVEMQRRNKVGGILDRRIGESDPTMTPEERALQRYARERQMKKGSSMFNLEEESDDEEGGQLTHLGQALDLGSAESNKDDFNDADMGLSAEEDGGSNASSQARKRKRSLAVTGDADGDNVENLLPRKKTKTEVMKEVIAKSKLHKYERQQAKEDDDVLRQELDKGLPDILAALKGGKTPVQLVECAPAVNGNSDMHPDRAALLDGTSKTDAEKAYDERLRQMAFDKRSQPTQRTKTEEEKAEDEAQRLREMEEERVRRMRGEEDEEGLEDAKEVHEDNENDELLQDDAAGFGLLSTVRPVDRDVEDEDEFLIDDDLVGSISEDSGIYESAASEAASDLEDGTTNEEDEFIGDLLKDEQEEPKYALSRPLGDGQKPGLAFTYPCPQDHKELLDVMKDVFITETPLIVQRIRALYHPSLNAENKAKMARFSAALVHHLSFLAMISPPLTVISTLIRHLHSLSRTFPEVIATAFRSHLQGMCAKDDLFTGDVIILTAIGSIYPTSDHFHQVTTPAITVIARWLGMTSPRTSNELLKGAYLVALSLKYQRLSKRYIPEALRFTVAALKSDISAEQLQPHIRNIEVMADLWAQEPAFSEIFGPEILELLSQRREPKIVRKLQILRDQSRLSRRPLELHHHRPLSIKTSYPKFEESFNPDKHYDPDRDRADSSKLRAEYKREKKGVLRELRKDACFIAREKLREKKEADRAYEAKYKRLVAEIQGDEGRQKNEYEREKRARKTARR